MRQCSNCDQKKLIWQDEVHSESSCDGHPGIPPCIEIWHSPWSGRSRTTHQTLSCYPQANIRLSELIFCSQRQFRSEKYWNVSTKSCKCLSKEKNMLYGFSLTGLLYQQIYFNSSKMFTWPHGSVCILCRQVSVAPQSSMPPLLIHQAVHS